MTTVNPERDGILASMHERIRELECRVLTLQHAAEGRQANNVPDIVDLIRCRELHIVDETGEIRIELSTGIHQDKTHGITLIHPDGSPAAHFEEYGLSDDDPNGAGAALAFVRDGDETMVLGDGNMRGPLLHGRGLPDIDLRDIMRRGDEPQLDAFGRSRADVTLDAIALLLDALEEDDDLGMVIRTLRACVEQIAMRRPKDLQETAAATATADEEWAAVADRLRARVEWLKVLSTELKTEAFEAEQLAERWGAAVRDEAAS